MFRPHEPDPDRKQVEMREAPADGYAREMTITSEHMDRLRRGGPGQSFYFKGNGMYGRGRLNACIIDWRKKLPILWFTLQLQPDGSRNLDTGMPSW